MSAEGHSPGLDPSATGERAHVMVDELFWDVPVQSAEDLACEGIIDSDEELDEFLQHIYAAPLPGPSRSTRHAS